MSEVALNGVNGKVLDEVGESSWPVYPEYKNSEMEWVGRIPAHWHVKKLKYLANIQNSNVDKKTVEGEYPVQLCNYVDVYNNDFITSDIPFMVATATKGEIRKFKLMRDDVIITKDSESWDDIAVPAYVKEDFENVICGYHLAQIQPIRSELYGKYLFRCFSASGINNQFKVAANGVTRFGISKYSVGSSIFLVPPYEEQIAIASFLDNETTRIDTLINKKQRLVELLHEKRTALISQAVTKGLNPSVPMKDSGFERVGETPVHWEVIRLGRKIMLQRGVDITKDEQEEGEVPVISSGGVSSFHNVALAKGPGVLVGRKGSAGAVYYVDEDYWPHDTTLWVKEFRGNLPRYVFYKLFSMDLKSFNTGSSNPTVNRNLIHPVFVSWPPIEEQILIANFIDRESSMIETISSRIMKAIGKLQEYRSALITAAVTGKIDVRQVG